MKRILITGKNSYIGTSFEKYLSKWPDQYEVHTIDMHGNAWQDEDFSNYETIFHVAGIAHSDSGKIPPEKEKLYRSVNTDLAVATAKKAKDEGVAQFIYMSSIIVYGQSSAMGKEKIITKDTRPNPENCYGDSKLQADVQLHKLNDTSFKVVSLRPPMIYGKNCKGNFQTLVKIAKALPIFPDVKNQRSMLYIENLCEFVRQIIDRELAGIFYPQNEDYVNTSEMVRLIGKANGKNIRLTKLFNWALHLLRPFTGLVDKAFGSLTYDKRVSLLDEIDYQVKTLAESIEVAV